MLCCCFSLFMLLDKLRLIRCSQIAAIEPIKLKVWVVVLRQRQADARCQHSASCSPFFLLTSNAAAWLLAHGRHRAAACAPLRLKMGYLIHYQPLRLGARPSSGAQCFVNRHAPSQNQLDLPSCAAPFCSNMLSSICKSCHPPQAIEDMCRAQLGQALMVYSKEVPLAQARKINGLRAVFGEVRVRLYL